MNKKYRILVSAMITFAMLFAYVPDGYYERADAAEGQSDEEWEEVRQLLAGIKGEWNDQIYNRALVNGMPDTALLGNGDIGVTSNGGPGFKTFHIAKGDFWNANPRVHQIALGGVTIKAAGEEDGEVLGENLALGAVATASSHDAAFLPQRVVNGGWGPGYEGWVTSVGLEHWIELDLGEPKTFARYIVKHDEAARPAEANNNTRDFALQASSDGVNWETLDAVTGNSGAVTDRSIEAITAQFVRLEITVPTQGGDNPRARIGQIELYELPSNANLALNATVSASAYFEEFYPERAVNGQWRSGYEGWVTPVGMNHWIALDLGSEQTIARYIVKHDEAARAGEGNNNTRDFTLQQSADGTDWIDVDSVTGNESAVTDRNINPITTRYLRLNITNPTQGDANPRVRIGQIELYALPGDGVPPETTPNDDNAYFKEEMNILQAEIDTWINIGGADLTMKTWTAANDNVVVTEISSLAANSEAVELEAILWAGVDGYAGNYPADAGADEGAVWVVRESGSGPRWISRAAMASRVLGAASQETSVASGNSAVTAFVLEPGQTARVVTAVGGGGQNTAGHLQEARQLSDGVDAAALDALHAEHLDWWKEYWLKSYVNLNDEVLEQFYYSSLYFMGSSSRAGKLAPGIFGIWVNTDQPMWDNDMHLNYNFMGPFYGLYSSNRPETALPFYDLILDYVPEAKRRSAEDLNRMNPSYIGPRFGTDGITGGVLFPVGIGPYGSTTDDNYHTQVANSLFSVSQFITYFVYTQDMQFLETKAYDFMKDVATFFESYLE